MKCLTDSSIVQALGYALSIQSFIIWIQFKLRQEKFITLLPDWAHLINHRKR